MDGFDCIAKSRNIFAKPERSLQQVLDKVEAISCKKSR